MSGGILTQNDIRSMLCPLLSKYDMESASVFGSYARGDADENSDIDILLVGKKGFKPLGIFGIAEELHRLSGKRVDVYEISELDDGPFRSQVLEEAVAL